MSSFIKGVEQAMANLNFQQPPRSIASQSLSRGGFSSSSLSGHVTPTSGMFPGSSSLATSFTPQQLSPNRNLPPQMGSRGLFGGQRAFPDRRTMPGIGVSNSVGNMGFGGIQAAAAVAGRAAAAAYGSQQQQAALNSFHSVFGGSGGDNSTPPLLDLSEFPSLTNRGGGGSSGGGAGGGSSGGPAGQGDSLPQPSPMPGKQPYVGMVKQPTTEPSEFTMSSEDFPALPGTQNTEGPSSVVGGGSVVGSSTGTGGPVVSSAPSVVGSSGSTIVGTGISVASGGAPGGASSTVPGAGSGSGMAGTVVSIGGLGSVGGPSIGGPSPNEKGSIPSSCPGGIGPVCGLMSVSGLPGSELLDTQSSNRTPGSDKSFTIVKRGIQTSPDGKVTNIPSSMVKDQFGMVGLLTFIRAAETDPNLVSLALGQDLTALGLNLNSPDNLYPNFGGPWAETPCRPQDIDFHVPPEYLINQAIREKLAPVKLNRYKDDLLFYMFYTNVGDVLQLAAAAELYSREWRYHMDEKVWITQAPGMGIVEKTTTYERGTYFFFDAQTWRKVPKEFHLDYNKLEGRPHLPPTFLPAAQTQVV